MNFLNKLIKKDAYLLFMGGIFLFLIIFVWLRGISLPSSYNDPSFHLATAQGFIRAGGVVTWDFWESLPLGRPHNYPPLLHIILADLIKLTSNPTIALKILMELTLVGGMICYAFGILKLFNSRIAFWSVFLLAFSFHFVQLAVTIIPAASVVFLTPLLFYFFLNKKWLSYSLVLVAMFYLHLFLPYLVILSLIIYTLLFNRRLFKNAILPTIISFILYLPWLIHIFSGGFEYIKYLDKSSVNDIWRSYVLMNISIILLAFLGLFCLRKYSSFKNNFYLFYITALVMLSPSFLVAGRIIDGHFLPFAVIFAALTLSQINLIWLKIPTFAFLAFYCWSNPTLQYGANSKMILLASPLQYLLTYRDPAENDPALKLKNIIDYLRQNSSKGSSITTDLKYFDNYPTDRGSQLSISNMIDGYTGLSTLNLRQPEIYKRSAPDLTKSSYLLLNHDIATLNKDYFFGAYEDLEGINKYIKNNFKVVARQANGFDTIYLYKNLGTDLISDKAPSFKFPFWLTNLILGFWLGLLINSMKNEKK